MMMKMLGAGGLTLLTDRVREADEDNPNGYYELERVRNLPEEKDKMWLQAAKGKAIKVVSTLLPYLPSIYPYAAIFMNRDLGEVMASQNKMLRGRAQRNTSSQEEMTALFAKHLKIIKAWLDRQSHFNVLHLDYNRILRDPLGQAKLIRDFLGTELDLDRMVSAVDTQLYRNRESR